MALLTFAELRSYHHFNGGESHAPWCRSLTFCDGQCTASAGFVCHDGTILTATIVLYHNGLLPALTYSVDGHPRPFDPHVLAAGEYQRLCRQVRQWTDGYSIPDPSRRPTPSKEAVR